MNRWIPVLVVAVAGAFYISLNSGKSQEVPREKLSSRINSEYQEVRPIISADGTTLYFSRRNHPENTGGVRDYQDIWVSKYIDGEWSLPVKLPAPLNNKKTNTLCSITSDGHYALLLDSYKRVKTPLAQAYDSPAGWGAPGDLVIRDFINLSSYYDFYFNEQTKVLLSAVDDGKGYGEQDLQVSFKQEDGSYSRPQNLGKAINTPKSEFAPFLAADGKTLYFSSFGHKGLGGSDFYVSYRLDDSWKNWSEPKNLGPGINSKDHENYFSITADLSYIYFESYPEGSEEKDIYRAPLPRQFHPELMAPVSETAVIVSNDEARTTSQMEQGIQDLGNLITRQYLEDGLVQSKILNNSYFQYNSCQLSPEGISRLREISEILQAHPSMEAQLTGHADNWGTNGANLRISYLRAQTAAHFLIDQGISGHRLQVIAKGEEGPLASNDDEKDGRELNRRVEVTLINSAEVYRGYSQR